MQFYLIVALQVFCMYHVYKNQNSYYWFLPILFIPLLGSIIYILIQVFSKSDANKIQTELTAIINPTKKTKDLEDKLEFSDTYTNRINLADAYFQNADYQKAIENYEQTLLDKVQDPTYAHQQLILCYFQLKDYDCVIKNAQGLKSKIEFKGSKEQFYYGLALKELGDIETAETQLIEVDRPFSNYAERLLLAKFYLDSNRAEKGKTLLNDILEESQHMTKPNRRLYNATIVEVERILKA